VEARYVIFDLDDTLVHSDAVREAFGVVADAHGIDRDRMRATLDALPGRPAKEIFEQLGLSGDTAARATEAFLRRLDDLNAQEPPVAYPDAHTTLRELAARGAQLLLSTGSSAERAKRVLQEEGWDGFTVVLGSDEGCSKGDAHYTRFAQEAKGDAQWTHRAVTVGDSPQDMRLGAQHGVPIRIGVDRDGDPRPLFAAGATHVVSELAEVVTILAAVRGGTKDTNGGSKDAKGGGHGRAGLHRLARRRRPAGGRPASHDHRFDGRRGH
jgi:phosphoglycolate phosphatase-like HAD superfamily hydrolase